MLENQRSEIEKFAEKKGLTIQKWQMEKISGVKKQEERKLSGTLKKLKKDDVLIVSEMSRLSRTMLEIMSILNTCIKKEITLYSVKEGYSFENSMTSKVMGFAFGMAAEIERNLIASRTREALAYRKAQGVVLGRPKGSNTRMQVLIDNDGEIRKMIERGMRKSDIAHIYGVSKATLYNFLKRNVDREMTEKEPSKTGGGSVVKALSPSAREARGNPRGKQKEE